jgi:YVTN family beta-propeller protein
VHPTASHVAARPPAHRSLELRSANREDGTVTRIDPATDRVAATVRLGLAPHGVDVRDGAAWATVRATTY